MNRKYQRIWSPVSYKKPCSIVRRTCRTRLRWECTGTLWVLSHGGIQDSIWYWEVHTVTKGGLSNKTLNVALAGTGVGKSLFMCHMAAACLSQGKNVLYITMEMSEEKIVERIDANLLNVNIKDIGTIPEQIFTSRVAEIGRKTQGRLIIKEYPTASAHAGHFKGLLNELSLKKYFKPDIVFVDYLNICASSRYKGHIVNSYTYVKATQRNSGVLLLRTTYVVSATQTTRAVLVIVTLIHRHFWILGLPATADFMFALISTGVLNSLTESWLNNLRTDTTILPTTDVSQWVLTEQRWVYNVEDSDADNILDTEDEDTFETFEDASSKKTASINSLNLVWLSIFLVMRSSLTQKRVMLQKILLSFWPPCWFWSKGCQYWAFAHCWRWD